VDNTSLRLDIYSPKKDEGRLPALVWIHGGSWLEGNRDFCPIAFMATQHLTIVSIDYRLSGQAKFPAQLFDCKGAIRWLRANADRYHIDPAHIGVFGASAGGHLAALLGTTADLRELEGDVGGNENFSSRVQAVCAFYPPIDLPKLVKEPSDFTSEKTTLARLLGGPLNQNMDKARGASPINYVTKTACPFFLFYCDRRHLHPLLRSRPTPPPGDVRGLAGARARSQSRGSAAGVPGAGRGRGDVRREDRLARPPARPGAHRH
jgi:acetyl esterase/lipase